MTIHRTNDPKSMLCATSAAVSRTLLGLPASS
jgi:hypothetical protein